MEKKQKKKLKYAIIAKHFKTRIINTWIVNIQKGN